MSQIASFTYLKESDVPFLGFWSKPKPRFFRKPESKFVEWLQQHTLRESIFEAADGVYVALVFAWLELEGEWIDSEADPVLHTVRKHVGGSHWLVKPNDLRSTFLIKQPLSENDWPSFLGKIGDDKDYYHWPCFDVARHFVTERLLELQTGEAMLVSVG